MKNISYPIRQDCLRLLRVLRAIRTESVQKEFKEVKMWVKKIFSKKFREVMILARRTSNVADRSMNLSARMHEDRCYSN